MADKLVSVNDDYDFPAPVLARLASPGNPFMEGVAGNTAASAYAIQRLDRQGIERARSGAGNAAADYADAAEVMTDWASTTGWVGEMRTEANRLYRGTASGAAGHAMTHAFTVKAGERARFSTVIKYVTGGAATYFGLDTSAPGAGPVALFPGGAFIGFNGSGNKSQFIGSSFGATALDFTTIGTAAATSGDYLAAIEVDQDWVTFSLTRVDSVNDITTYKVSRATLAAAGKTINNIVVYTEDTRFTSGTSFGPVSAVRSLQAYRTKTLAGAPTSAQTHRTITIRGKDGDAWRIGIPAGYDPRRPAPVAMTFHQSLTGNEKTPWSETRIQPLTKALLDAGYIVAAAHDGGDRWGNQTSLDNYFALYEYIRSNFATGPLFFLGISMGGLVALNALSHRQWPTPAAAATIGGVCDLDVLYRNATYAPGIRAAYGIAADGSDYEAKTAGHNPIKLAGHEFRGAPIRFYTATGDTAVPPATNQEPMSAKMQPFGAAEVVYRAGGHLDGSQYDAVDLLAFFDSYR